MIMLARSSETIFNPTRSILVVDHTNNIASIFWREIENDPLLRLSDTNKESSHTWVASTTFKQL